MKYLKIIVCLIIVMFCINVKADDSCTTDEMNRLKELASNVLINYTYELKTETEDSVENKYYVYKLSVVNLHDDLTLMYDNERISKQDLENLQILNGGSVSVKVYSYTANWCTHKILRTINLKLPYYNDYYYTHKEECDKYSNFKYCKEFPISKINISNEEIDKLFEKYKEENNKTDEDENNKIINFIKKNEMTLIIFSSVIVLTITVLIIINQKKKNAL